MGRNELDLVENADCQRIRQFLDRLAKDDQALVEFINNPPAFLEQSRLAGDLQHGDVLLLLSGDYERVQDLMKECNSAARWIVIWIV